MESSVPDTAITDQEVLTLIQQGQPLSDLLKEVIALRRWKEEQLKAQHREAQRMERMLSRICVSIAAGYCTSSVLLCSHKTRCP